MSQEDLFIFVVGAFVTAMAFWGLIVYGVMAFRRWQEESEREAIAESIAAGEPQTTKEHIEELRAVQADS